MCKNINFVCQNFHENGNFNVESKLRYRWIQLTDALTTLWKDHILNCIGNSMNFCIFDHDLINKKQLILLEQVGK